LDADPHLGVRIFLAPTDNRFLVKSAEPNMSLLVDCGLAASVRRTGFFGRLFIPSSWPLCALFR